MFVKRVAAASVAALAVGLAVVHTAGAAEPPASVRVEAGDTVWGIAQQRYPNADTRAKVDEIMRLNRRHDPNLRPGETLKVPRH